MLGTRPGDDVKWQNCDLAKLLVDEDQLRSSTRLDSVSLPIGTVDMPQHLGFGVGTPEKQMLFSDLPWLSAQAGALGDLHGNLTAWEEKIEEGEGSELPKANMFAKVLDLRNANAGGIAYENRKRIILAFSTPENPFDPGRSEVQGMYATVVYIYIFSFC